MNALQPREIARDARRKAILDIARDAFLADGFAATSMSAIAVKLGGSKGTLYNYFRSKEELFAAIMAEECEGQSMALTALGDGGSLETVLQRLGEGFLRFITRARSVAIYRLVAGECQRFPQLGVMFWENGPSLTLRAVTAYLAEQMQAGILRDDDPERAATQLLGLFKAQVHQAVLWNVRAPLTDAELTAHIQAAVQTFLHGYSKAEPT
jgi:AcrR family transcriptional regulator